MKFYSMLFLVLLTVTLSCAFKEDEANDGSYGGEVEMKRDSDNERQHEHDWHGRREAEQPRDTGAIDTDDAAMPIETAGFAFNKRHIEPRKLNSITIIVNGATQVIDNPKLFFDQLRQSGVLVYLRFARGQWYYISNINVNLWASRLAAKYGRSSSFWTAVLRYLPQLYTEFTKD